MVTVAEQMEAFFDKLRRVACSSSTVLLSGETGTGKELAAQAIHAESARRHAPFEAINCAALTPTMLESELFGHVRGAFTDAVQDHAGVFARANGGSLFLDEVADIPFDLQAKLLRVMQEKTFVPIGATRALTVDVRVVAATNKSLRREVAEGRFRADLSYRLRVVPLLLPPLRERAGDVDALVWHFIAAMNRQGLRRVDAVASTAMVAMRSYQWPGNVRELQSAIEYAFVTGKGPVLEMADLPDDVSGNGHEPIDSVHDGERARILASLVRHNGRRGAAAADLGMSRSTLWRKLSMHRLQ